MRLRNSLLAALALLVAGIPAGAATAAEFSCSDKPVTAKGIRVRDDIRAFVLCAAEYVQTMGTAEAHRAFHEDERWHSGAYYLFVDTLAASGDEVITLVYPPDPNLEGIPSGDYPDDFGADIHAERYRILKTVGRGWWYYGWTDFTTGLIEPKASYVTRIDWDGAEALVGAGIYEDDLPGTCHPADRKRRRSRSRAISGRIEGVRQLRSARVRIEGLLRPIAANHEPALAERIDLPVRIRRIRQPTVLRKSRQGQSEGRLEWGSDLQAIFSNRDPIKIAMTFGDAYFYYSALNPAEGRVQDKIGYVKRVVAQGVPILIGSGYYLD